MLAVQNLQIVSVGDDGAFAQIEIVIFVYRKGDIVKQPMKKGSFVPKNVPGGGVGGS